MNLSDAFPSNYLKSDDLQGRDVTVVIASVTEEVLGDKKKIILTFQGKKKSMVCNKTNANRIAFLYGDQNIDEEWIGKEIVLTSEFVEFQGKTVKGLRVKPPAKRNGKTAAADPGYQTSSGPSATPVRQQAPADDNFSDEIPF